MRSTLSEDVTLLLRQRLDETVQASNKLPGGRIVKKVSKPLNDLTIDVRSTHSLKV